MAKMVVAVSRISISNRYHRNAAIWLCELFQVLRLWIGYDIVTKYINCSKDLSVYAISQSKAWSMINQWTWKTVFLAAAAAATTTTSRNYDSYFLYVYFHFEYLSQMIITLGGVTYHFAMWKSKDSAERKRTNKNWENRMEQVNWTESILFSHYQLVTLSCNYLLAE